VRARACAAAAAAAAGETAAFSRERKEMRENFDKEAKAMKRQIEILQVCANVPARARLRVHLWRVGALGRCSGRYITAAAWLVACSPCCLSSLPTSPPLCPLSPRSVLLGPTPPSLPSP
jgi:hypothetical protein